LGDATDAAGDAAGAAGDAAQDAGNTAANAVGGAAADSLGLSDFYSAHLMAFCQGDITEEGDQEVKKCSERKAFFSFDPTEMIPVKWPEEVTTGVKAINAASKATFFFYVTGITLAGLAMIGAGFGLLAYEHLVAMANLGINAVSTLLSRPSSASEIQTFF
jgi:SUR7/PalI family